MSEGANPLDVAAALQRLGRRPPEPAARYDPPRDERPELHVLEDEWYFDEATALALAREYVAGRASVMLGCPTVARETALLDAARPLIDLSAALPQRLERWRIATSLIAADLRKHLPSWLDGQFEVVLFDPPWHMADVLVWLRHATRLCRPGGLLVFPVFQRLTKPAAEHERERVLAQAERVGRVDIERRTLCYSTPGFEHAAALAAGVFAPPAWRTADLAVVRVERNVSTWPEINLAPGPRDAWWTWVLGTQVVKLRQRPTRPAETPLAPLDGTVHHVLPSVSRRHALREQIGLWTSRNRVAAVGDPARVGRWLDRGVASQGHEKLLADLLAADA
jgi:SAM-dependent methyltransferase